VSLSEQLSPLLGVDMTFNTEAENEPQLKVELKRDRNVAFGLTNFQVTETKSNALVIGFGYKFKDVPNPFIKTYGKLPGQNVEGDRLGAAGRLEHPRQSHHHPKDGGAAESSDSRSKFDFHQDVCRPRNLGQSDDACVL
jgi:hypothetical protein